MKEYFDMPTHVQVFLRGRCAKCQKYNKKLIHDYGKCNAKELEEKMDEVSHYITPIICSNCNQSYSAEHLYYYDLLLKSEVTRVNILHGSEMDPDEYEPMQKAHQQRHEIFKRNEKTFWKEYTDFALENWRDCANELQEDEIRTAYAKLGITSTCRTKQQFRRDVLTRFKSEKEKAEFWKCANHGFIYEHILDLGPLAWYLPGDAQTYGINRVRFVVLNFPMGEELEPYRTKLIGSVVKKKRGDNAFLFRRISQLTDEITRIRKKIAEYHRKNEELKAEVEEKNRRLNELYTELKAAKESRATIERNPDDIRKIHELKSFVSELMKELRDKDESIRQLQPADQEQTKCSA